MFDNVVRGGKTSCPKTADHQYIYLGEEVKGVDIFYGKEISDRTGSDSHSSDWTSVVLERAFSFEGTAGEWRRRPGKHHT